MQSSTNGKTVRLSDKSRGTQLFVKWFFRLLWAWIVVMLSVIVLGIIFDPFSSS
ncbi:MAG: hypothetical protein AAGC79_04325 [Pseudomonadota bacterium]